MCGIAGVFAGRGSVGLLKKAMHAMAHRGRDGCGLATDTKTVYAKSVDSLQNQGSYAIGHLLHSVVGSLRQPIDGRLAANCEVYNWKELCAEHKISARNDAELLLRVLDMRGTRALRMLDADYAFCHIKDKTVMLARDILGIKPLFYSTGSRFAFASEKKALLAAGFVGIAELCPRQYLLYDIAAGRLARIKRRFSLPKETKKTGRQIQHEVQRLLTQAVRKRLEKRVAVLFSGGIDSTLIALLCQQLGARFTCYTAAFCAQGMQDAPDLVWAGKAARHFGFDHRVVRLGLNDVQERLKRVIPAVEDTNVTKAGVGVVLDAACEQAAKDGYRVILSGLGSEEIFAGYQRHRNSQDINRECLVGLLAMYERDTYRDDTVSMLNSLELRVPFLDLGLVRFALKIPARYKIEDDTEKAVLRKAAVNMGVPAEFACRKKAAAQYGSRVDRAIHKLAKRSGHRLKSGYLKGFCPGRNQRLGALVSGGKDSLYAMYVMHRQNYTIDCLITLKSKNPDSYMFHTPAIDLVSLQAESLHIPLVWAETEGKKEHELADLRQALVQAKELHRIDGVVTGALYSTYQRNRILRVCESLGLKMHSPLWHLDQESEMRQLLSEGFKIIMTAVAAQGLDASWLGRPIASKDVDSLVRLHEKYRLNVAGEGGEFETLVLYMPMFNKRLRINKQEKIMESRHAGRLMISDATLEDGRRRDGRSG